MDIQPVKLGSVGNLIAHIDRTRGQEDKYQNQNIRHEDTHLNYSLSVGLGSASDNFTNKYEEAKILNGRKVRSDANVLGMVVVTLPKEYKDYSEIQKTEFFKTTVEYLRKTVARGGGEVYAVVHNDETSSHLHYGFIPLVEAKKGKRKGKLKIAWGECMPKRFFEKNHTQFDKYLRKNIEWYKGGVLDTTTSLKAQTEKLSDFKKDKPENFAKLDAATKVGRRVSKRVRKDREKRRGKKRDITITPEEQEALMTLVEQADKKLFISEYATELLQKEEQTKKDMNDLLADKERLGKERAEFEKQKEYYGADRQGFKEYAQKVIKQNTETLNSNHKSEIERYEYVISRVGVSENDKNQLLKEARQVQLSGRAKKR